VRTGPGTAYPSVGQLEEGQIQARRMSTQWGCIAAARSAARSHAQSWGQDEEVSRRLSGDGDVSPNALGAYATPPDASVGEEMSSVPVVNRHHESVCWQRGYLEIAG
jgi:hypothetical protein